MLLAHDISADWLRSDAVLQYQVKTDLGGILIDWTSAGVQQQSPLYFVAPNVVWDGSRDVTVYWKDQFGGTAEEYIPALQGRPVSPPDPTTGSAIIANLLTTIAAITDNGKPLFYSAGSVNDIESFVREISPVRAEGQAICGIVEGRIEELEGNTTDEESICRLPFDIVVRFRQPRRPGAAETDAMQRAKYLLETIKTAILMDRSRGGLAGLVQWQGEVINGTSVRGTIQPVSKIPNEAFFSAVMSGACAWTKLRP